jgi:predicted SAM-dependent methyltransferase
MERRSEPMIAVDAKVRDDESLPQSLRSRTVLNLGCGRKPIEGAINVDSSPDVSPDLLMDLDAKRWRLPSNHFTEVHAYDVIEHLTSVVAALEEVHRICRNGARVKVTVPHFSSANAFTDPTHRHFFGRNSFTYFTGEHAHAHYSRARFRSVQTKVIFRPGPLNALVRRAAERFPDRYEERFAWMFPAWFMFVELEVVKPDVVT